MTAHKILVPKFFTFAWSLGWVDKYRGLYIHSYSWEEDWIVFTTVPSPRRLGHGPGGTLHYLLKFLSTKDCGCGTMADKYDIGVVDKNKVINFMSKGRKHLFPLIWILVNMVDLIYVWKENFSKLSSPNLHWYDDGRLP